MNTANPTQPDPVTALTRECAEKIYALNRGWSCSYPDFETIIAATLRPVVEERDQLRAEVEQLQNVVTATRQTSIDAMAEIRRAAGAPDAKGDKTQMRAVDYVAQLRAALTAAKGE